LASERLLSSVIVCFFVIGTRPNTYIRRATLLFMYQHDQHSVFRHLFKLQLFRIPRKPCSPDISSDG
jgi:hypothetical protein